MRFGLILLVLLFALLGAAFGALNSQNIDFDFYFGTLSLAKGGVLLGALVLGWLLGGLLVFVSLVLPLRRRVRLQARRVRQLEAGAGNGTPGAPVNPPVIDG
jgi:uncharacterized integral membrane protein